MANGRRRRAGGWPAAALLGLLLLSPVLHGAVEGPHPPCGGAPLPPYPAVGAAPLIATWSQAQLSEHWEPPACTGWPAGGFTSLVALAGRIDEPAGADDLLARFGAVSALRGVLFWSIAAGRWAPMFTRAAALTGPDGARRADFTPAELRSGRDLYLAETENSAVGEVVYRLRVRQATPDRLVLETVNVTSVRWLFFSLFGPGDLRTDYFLDRLPGGGWGYYSLVRVGSGASRFAQGTYGAYANRMLALYRHMAGIPTDREPPAVR